MYCLNKQDLFNLVNNKKFVNLMYEHNRYYCISSCMYNLKKIFQNIVIYGSNICDCDLLGSFKAVDFSANIKLLETMNSWAVTEHSYRVNNNWMWLKISRKNGQQLWTNMVDIISVSYLLKMAEKYDM